MSSRCDRPPGSALFLLLLLVFPSCERELRPYRQPPVSSAQPQRERLVSLVGGPYTPDVQVRSPYEGNAFGIAEGKRLYTWFNCVGCHAHGGGGMGPPLMDDKWIYGGEPEQIFATIVEGRPNGMPSWGGKIPQDQVWQLVAYVQSLSGHVPKDAAPGRADGMFVKKPENMTPDLIPERDAARHP